MISRHLFNRKAGVVRYWNWRRNAYAATQAMVPLYPTGDEKTDARIEAWVAKRARAMEAMNQALMEMAPPSLTNHPALNYGASATSSYDLLAPRMK